MYSREIDGKVLTLAASGWTYNFTFVLYDKETESLWYHLRDTTGLTCVSGFYKDRTLPEFPSTKTRWFTWKASHPFSKYLRYDPIR